MAGHAVAHGAHATGVGRHVPAERTALFARRDRVDQPERRELVVELFQCHPRFHHGHLILGVDLHNPLHAVEGEQDAVRHGHGGPGEPGPAAPCDHRHQVLTGDLQHRGHFAGRAGHDDGPRHDGHGRQRLVVGVVGVHGIAGEDVAFADGFAQLL